MDSRWSMVDEIESKMNLKKWSELTERLITESQGLQNMVLLSLNKQIQGMVAKERQRIERTIETELKRDENWVRLSQEAGEREARLKQAQRGLAMMGLTWEKLKIVFSSNKPNLTDEERWLQRSVYTLTESLAQTKKQLKHMRDLAVNQYLHDFIQKQIGLPEGMASDVTERYKKKIEDFSDMCAQASVIFAQTREFIISQMDATTALLADLDETVQTYINSLAVLVEKYQSFSDEYQQGTREFAEMVLDTLKSFTPLSAAGSGGNKCGIKDAGFQRMVYDVSKAHDSDYDSEEEDLQYVKREGLSAEASKAKAKANYPFTPEIYQEAMAAMFSPAWSINLLMYHEAGSGKTCSMLLALQKMAQYYLHHPQVDDKGKCVVPGALILMQSNNGLDAYFEEINKFCTNKEDMHGLRLYANKDVSAEKFKNSREWFFVSKGADVSTCLHDKHSVVMKVVVHKMSTRLLLCPEWAAGPLTRKIKNPTDKPWELPRVGAVFIDEAHNLIDTCELKTSQHHNHTTVFMAQMTARTDLKKLYSTGTPTLNSSSFANLAKMLDMVRSNQESILDTTPPACSDKAADTVAFESGLSAAETKARSAWFYRQKSGKYAWLPCAEQKFKRLTFGYVSYVNMEKDASAFPQFAVKVGDKTYKTLVSATFTAEQEEHVGKRKAKVKRGGKMELTDIEVTGFQPPLLLINCKALKQNLSAEKAMKTDRGLVGKHFQKLSDTPNKWFALRYILVTNLLVKHFVFLEKNQDSLLQTFCKWFKSENASDPSLEEKFRNPTEFAYQPIPGNVYESDFIAKTLKEIGPGYRYIVLGNETHITTFLKYFNHPMNSRGKYIAIVMGGLVVKEQVTIREVPFVHLLQAPKSASLFNQVIKRVNRRCSMSNLPPNEWSVTVVIYHTEQSSYETKALAIVLESDKTPVELAYRAMQSSAIDCVLYSQMTGIQCDSGDDAALVPKYTNEYCVYPAGGKAARKLIRFTRIGDQVTYDEPMCLLDEGVPGALLSFDIFDEILFQLLSASYTPVPLAPEDAAQLLNFSTNAMVQTGVWLQQQQEPRLTFSREVHPEVLLEWVLASPRAIGDSLLFLLDEKRNGADPDVVNFLGRKAAMYLQRIQLDKNLQHDMVTKMDMLRSIQRDVPDLEALRSASLLVDAEGKSVEAMSRSVHTYYK
ncbi:hypothetical protein JKP88DRAFT_241012 [Tribonema minus]|uniref:Helicase ATP-binding domain-containing protein n=1 Tax=Tribonema minus TaxID=303371 RepID=A0A835Z5B3_9STRA|nr:hypothetical protein JKP88DRAFT_241012 [Tribonema minus]